MCKAIVVSNDAHSAQRLLEGALLSLGVRVVFWASYRNMSGGVVGHKADVGIVNTPGIESNVDTIAALLQHEAGVECVTVEARKVRSIGKRNGKSNRDLVDVSNVARWIEAHAPAPKPSPTVHDQEPPPCVICGKPAMKRKNGGGTFARYRRTCSDECYRVLQRENSKRRSTMAKPVDAQPLSPDALVPVGGERLVPDTILGERLGYARDRRFRQVITDHKTDVERRFGPIHVRTDSVRTSMPRGGERIDEVDVYLLTKRQALYVITKAGTSNANDVVQELVKVYDAVTSAYQSPDDDSLVHVLAAATDAKLAKHEDRIAALESRPTSKPVDKDAIVRETTDRLANTWRERDSKRRQRAQPGPVLPIQGERIGDTTQLRHDLQEGAMRVLREIGCGNDKDARYFASNRINYHGRLVAGIAFGRPLKGPLGWLPAIAYKPLHEAFTSDQVIAKAARETEEWLTK